MPLNPNPFHRYAAIRVVFVAGSGIEQGIAAMQRAQHAIVGFHGIDQRPSQGRASPSRNQTMGTGGVDIRPQTDFIVDRRVMAFEGEQQGLSRH